MKRCVKEVRFPFVDLEKFMAEARTVGATWFCTSVCVTGMANDWDCIKDHL